MEVGQEVKIIMVRQKCDKCGKGYMEPGDIVLTSYPPLYPHTCTKCGYSENYTKRYPYQMTIPVSEEKELGDFK
mgnify:FL=1